MESRKLLKNGKPRGKLTKKDITKNVSPFFFRTSVI